MQRILLTTVVFASSWALSAIGHGLADGPPQGPERWESDIQTFEEQDLRATPPATGGVLFVGSSSIRNWDLKASFPGLDPLNRGFGGSEVADSLHFADRIVLPYQPRTIVMYAGDNDISGGKTPAEVHGDFLKFARLVRRNLPETKIVYISIKPSIKRWSLVQQMREANALIRATCANDERLEFVDVDASMLGEDGQPRPELFVQDGLHLNAAGYQLWSDLVRPHLE